MRPGQNFYYSQGNSGFRPDQQPQQNPEFLSPLYAGPHDLHSGVQVVTLPVDAVAQQYAVTPIPPSQQWGHRRESQGWGSGVFPSQGLGTRFHGQQFAHHEPNVAYIPQQHHGGEGFRGPFWCYGRDGPNGQFDRNPIHQELRRPADGMLHIEHQPNERGPRGSSRDKSHDDSRSGSWSNGCGSSNSRIFDHGSSNSRTISRGRNAKGRGGTGGMDREPVRSQAVSLRCEPCDRTLTNAQQFAAHKSTHVKCDVKGCSFEASGRVVKEHNQTCHDSSSASAPSRSGLFKSKECEEEILRWREERKRNYPTSANIKHKAEEMQASKARGELFDEDARKRRERLKEILARQAELGVPVAELPAFYLSDRYSAPKGKGDTAGVGRKDNNRSGKRRHNSEQVHAAGSTHKEDGSEPPIKQARIDESNVSTSVEPAAVESEVEGVAGAKTAKPEQSREAGTEAFAPSTSGKGPSSGKSSKQLCYFFKRGRCKKGNRCEYLHERRSERQKKPRKDAAPGVDNKRQPSLLYKLLESEIRREKSHLLQAFRFFVNNNFLLEYPEKPFKFFEWTDVEELSVSDVEVARLDKRIQEELKSVIENTEDEADQDEEENEEDEDDDSASANEDEPNH